MNKRGQGQSSIGVIIAIALGVSLLVLLLFGVGGGFRTLWGKVTEIGGTDNNIGDIARGCEVACASNNVYDYCTKTRTFKFGDGKCVDKNTGLDCDIAEGKTCSDYSTTCGETAVLSCKKAEAIPGAGISCDIDC